MSDEEEIKPRYYRNHRLKQAKMQRQVRKTQKRLTRLKLLYKIFLIFGMFFACIFIMKMPQWRLPSDAFDSIDSPVLEIVNNQIVPSQKILSALRRTQVPRKPIFLVSTTPLKESIKKLEPIQDVYIRRFWFPARLQIFVLERTPAITIAPNLDVPPIAFFSSDGKLIGREYMPLDKSYETVLVITYGSGDDYRNWDVSKITNFIRLAKLIEAETGEKVEYIDYRNPKEVFVKIPTVNILIGSISPEVFDKIQRLPSLIPQVKMINKKVKYLDLRWDVSYMKMD
jgi:cell division septal protein FtsQ